MARICIHCYANTWAYQNFVGCNDNFNSYMGLLDSDYADTPDYCSGMVVGLPFFACTEE